MFSEEHSQLKDLLSITHSSAPRGIDSASLIFTRKPARKTRPLWAAKTATGEEEEGETLVEEQPGQREDEGETVAMEG